MFAATLVRRFVVVTTVLALSLWAVPARGDEQTVNQGFDFDNPQKPAEADPDERPKGVDPTTFKKYGDADYKNMGGKNQGTYGVEGADKNGQITLEVDNKHELYRKVIIVEFDALEQSGGEVSATVNPIGGDKYKVYNRRQKKDVGPGEGGNPWRRYRYEWVIIPQPLSERINFHFKTAKNNQDGKAFVDNVDLTTKCLKKNQKCYSFSYNFGDAAWPPESSFGEYESWYQGTAWDVYGSYTPEWMPQLTDHEGVIGMPGGLPADGVLSARFDDLAEAEGVKHVACQFACYAAEGGMVVCEVETPPGSTIENYNEYVEDRGDGWERRLITFDVTPPPDWEEFRFVMFTEPEGGPVAVDDIVVSAAPPDRDPWWDGFDPYENGSGLHGQYGWKGWDNDPAFDAYVTDAQAYSGFQSLDVAGDADVVHPFDEANSGQWKLTAWQYIPADFASGSGGPLDPGSYFLLLNTYNDGGPYNWSVQYTFDSNDGMLKVSYGNGHNTIDVPYVTERWVQIQANIDLDNDWTQVYYDGQLIAEYSWTGGIYGEGGGALNVAVVDLFANGSTSVYYDDVELVPDPNPELRLEMERNGSTGKLTARICPGEKGDLTMHEPTSDNPYVAEITSVTASNTTIDGESCGEMVVRFAQRQAGRAIITVPAGWDEMYQVDKAFIDVSDRLFSVSIPGGADFGEIHTSLIPPGAGLTCTLMVIDTGSGEPDSSANGLAAVTLTYNPAFTFDGGEQWQEVEFSYGMAEVTIYADGPAGEHGYLVVSDDDTPESVAGEMVVSEARISLATDWSENFDAYACGSGMHGQGGWKGWDNNPAFDALATDAQFQSDPHSVEIGGPSDLVHEFAQLNSGQWALTAWMYVPADFQSGCDENDNCGSYLILLNTYADSGPYHWSLQLHADSLTDSFTRDGVEPASAPLIRGEWADVKVLIDLDHDLYRVFYDGAELGTAESWSAGVYGDGGGERNVAAIDLYANDSTPVYWDDLSLAPYESECPGDLDGDGDTDQADLGILLANWGCGGGGCEGDLDGDDDTDQADLGILLADWGCGT